MKRIGPYEVIRELGHGAFGRVYLAQNPGSNDPVAIKVARHAHDRRVLAEGRSLMQLDHPGIVSMFEVGCKDDLHYLVSEYMSGPNLETALRSTSFDWIQSVRIVIAVAEALSHAHAHRVIHRDIKPANIILVEPDQPVLVDFDLAVDETSGAENLKGDFAGTLAYMSPEQVIGEGHRLDGRTDIYSLGVVLYRMLTGRLPFPRDDAAELKRQIREDDPQPPRQLVPNLPMDLDSICVQTLSKDYPDRQTTAGDLATQLRALLAPKFEIGGDLPAVAKPYQARDIDSSIDGSSFKKRRSQSSRQRVTVVRCECDVFESSVIATELDLEDQSDLLDEFREMCRLTFHRFGGTSAQLTEQGLLGCFGFPIASENATQNAVRAALEIQQRVKQLADRTVRRFDVPVCVKVAIHNDEAVLQASTEKDVTVSGRVLTLVGKIISSMPNHCVYVSESVCGLVAEYFDFIPAGRLDGVADHWPLQRVVGHCVSSRFEAAALSGALTPLTGRDREVRKLIESWRRTCEGGAEFVAICGSPGLGKSRLIHELHRHTQTGAGSHRTRFLQWRTSPQLQNTAFAPVIECLERILKFHSEPTPIKRLSRIVQHLDDLGMEGDEEVALLAELLSVPLAGCYPDLTFSPAEKKQKTLNILSQWLRAFAGQRPLLFAIEDLHWADPSTLELVHGVANQPDRESILTIVTYRPEFQSEWLSRRDLTEIILQRVTKKEMREMLVGRLGQQDIAPQMIDRIDSKTDGVPLFIEEFATTLLDSRASGNELAEFDERLIPGSLQELLMARLQKMAGDIELVQLGAAIGREFDEVLISATLDRSPETLRDELTTLVDSDLLYVTNHGATRTYSFRHALIQDAAYLALTRDHRQGVHRKIADTIEQQFEDRRQRHPEILAMHYSLADHPARAIQYWEKAGQQATERGANLEAEQHLIQAIEQLPRLSHDPKWTDDRREHYEVKLRVMLGVHLQSIYGYSAPEILDNYQKAVRASERLGDPLVKATLLYGLFRSDIMIGKLHRARELANELRELALQANQVGLTIISHRVVGCIAFFFGDFDSTRRHLEWLLEFEPTPELLQTIEQFDPVDPWITARAYLSITYWMLGYPDQSLRMAEETIELAAANEKTINLIFITGFSQWVHQFRGDVERTIQTCDRSDELGQKYGFPFWNAWTRTIRGWTLDARGDSEEAMEVLREGMQQWKNATMGRSYFLTLLGQASLNAGKLDAAKTALDDARKNADRTGDWFYATETMRLQGQLALQITPPDRGAAEKLFRDAFEWARDHNAKSLQLRAACSLAKLQIEMGDPCDAESTLAPILDWFSEGVETADLRQAHQLMDRIRQAM